MANAHSDIERFGPDATCVGLTAWLNAHSAEFSALFEDFNVRALILTETMTQTDPRDAHEMTDPVARLDLLLRSGEFVSGDAETATLSRYFHRARDLCDIDDRVGLAETYSVEVWRGGVATATVRYWDMDQFGATMFGDCLEQFFTWFVHEGAFEAKRIELEVWNRYAYELAEGTSEERGRPDGKVAAFERIELKSSSGFAIPKTAVSGRHLWRSLGVLGDNLFFSDELMHAVNAARLRGVTAYPVKEL